MSSSHDNQRVTLAEVERLLAAAEYSGTLVPDWLAQLAAELRAALPGAAVACPDVARRMLSDPRLTLGAHANVGAGALHVLKG
jgi:hypothetical protein